MDYEKRWQKVLTGSVHAERFEKNPPLKNLMYC
jgi:hypothetical protein